MLKNNYSANIHLLLKKVYYFTYFHSSVLVLTFVFFLMFFWARPIFAMSIFIVCDVLKSYFEKSTGVSIPIYFFDYGVIICSYLYNPIYGLMLIIAMLGVRILFADFKVKHLVKLPILFLLAILSNILNYFPLLYIGIGLFVLRYILEYTISGIMGNLSFEDLGDRVINIFSTLVFYIIFSNMFIAIG